MSKPKLVSSDPLVMKVRKALKDLEPRKMPTEKRKNPYGFECWVCPYCGELCHIRGRYHKENYGGYNMHFAATHSTPFWRENHIINVIKLDIAKRVK